MASSSTRLQSIRHHHLFIFLVSLSLLQIITTQDEQQADRVSFLPGHPRSPQVSHFSGYITVDQHRGRALFYWFFEAQKLPSQKPLLLWLNGGPGCSSVGYGAASELGPLLINGNGTGLEFNKFAWNKGHYVPQIAEVVYERNKHLETNQHINLKGFIVGNAETNDYYDYKGQVEFAWSHSVISDQLYERVNNVCDFRLSSWTKECRHVMATVYAQYDKIDIYNVYAPKCNTQESGLFSTSDSTPEMNTKKRLTRVRMYSGYDPCYSTYVEDYMNRMDVQKSLHANISGWIKDRRWSLCSYSIFDNYHDLVFSVLPIYSKLVKAGLRIWVYRLLEGLWSMKG